MLLAQVLPVAQAANVVEPLATPQTGVRPRTHILLEILVQSLTAFELEAQHRKMNHQTRSLHFSWSEH